MVLKAIYASGRPSFLSNLSSSCIPDVASTIEEDALCGAIERGSNTVIQWLIEKGASVDAVSKIGFRALHISVERGELETVRLLLDINASVNLIEIRGSSLDVALDSCLVKNRLAIVRLLLEHGADVSMRNRNNETVLYHAAALGLVKEVDLLLDNGAPIEDRQNDMTALMAASSNRRAGTTRLLLKRGADVNALLSTTGHDSLCLAITGKRRWETTCFQLEQTISSLIEYGADINGTAQKVSPLSLALLDGSDFHCAMIYSLLDAGADIKKIALMGQTPLESWISNDVWDCLHLFDLLLNKATVSKLNNERRSPLIQACAATGNQSMEQRVHITQKLIEYEADINQADENGDTPAMIICINRALFAWEKYRLILILLENGANTRSKNRQGETLFIKAIEKFDLGTKIRRLVLNLILRFDEMS